MALCFYVMVGFLRGDKRSNEAAIKYLLLGSFSSGFLVYGFSVLYGLSGSTKLSDISGGAGRRGARRIHWCSWRWPRPRWGCCSRSPPSRSTCGRRTLTRARPPRSPPIWRSGSKAASFAFLLRMFMGPLAPARERLGADPGGGRGGQHDGGQPGRHHPVQREAPAGIQLDFPRGLHPAGPDRGQRNRHSGRAGVRAGLHFHDPGRLPGGGGVAAQGHSGRGSSTTWRDWYTRAPATPS